MNRRQLLAGAIATAVSTVVPSVPIPHRYILRTKLPPQSWRLFNELSQRISHTLIYGNDEWLPTQFTGFIPRYDATEDSAP